MIDKRIQRTPGLAGRLRHLSPDEVREFVAAVERRFVAQAEEPDRRVDISDMDPVDVRNLLTQCGLREAGQCQLVWRADHEGVELDGAAFVQYYDDLWYPAGDDIWVTDRQRSWLLSIDHEEVLEHWSSRPSSLGPGDK